MALLMAERTYYNNNSQCEGRYANILGILFIRHIVIHHYSDIIMLYEFFFLDKF